MSSRQSQRFVVLASQRTGSNFLQSLLESNSGVICAGEVIIQPEHLERRLVNFQVGKEEIEALFRLHRRKRYLDYIERYYEIAEGLGCDAAGFRFFYDHLGFLGHRRMLKYILRNALPVVHLRRRNLLRQYLSLVVARQSEVWTSRESGEVTMVEVDPGECQAYFKAVEKKQRTHERYFGESQQFCLYYEDLLDNTQSILAAVQEFLGLSVETLDTPYKKRGTLALRDSVSNFDELERALRSGRWAAYLDD